MNIGFDKNKRKDLMTPEAQKIESIRNIYGNKIAKNLSYHSLKFPNLKINLIEIILAKIPNDLSKRTFIAFVNGRYN